jgi:hypothetical protein
MITVWLCDCSLAFCLSVTEVIRGGASTDPIIDIEN